MLRLTIAVAAALLSGCATQKILVDTGGSRSDGVVEMSYTYGVFEDPQVDYAQGQALAARRCAGWGYDSAEKFGGETERCISFDGYGGCNQAQVTVRYQCLKNEDR